MICKCIACENVFDETEVDWDLMMCNECADKHKEEMEDNGR